MPDSCVEFGWAGSRLRTHGLQRTDAPAASRGRGRQGGPRDELDEIYLKLGLTPEQAAGLAKIIREKRLQVARLFFGIHSGSYALEFAPMPDLRFTIHYGHSDENCNVIDHGELPNWTDEMFIVYTERS